MPPLPLAVNAGALNVRSGPSTRYRRLGQVYRGNRVQVTGSNGAWLQISYRGQAAWVHGSYLSPAGSGPAPTLSSSSARASSGSAATSSS